MTRLRTRLTTDLYAKLALVSFVVSWIDLMLGRGRQAICAAAASVIFLMLQVDKDRGGDR